MIIGFPIFVIDQISKIWVLFGLDLEGRFDGFLEVVPPFLNFRMAWNRGVNFGLFANDTDYGRWILVALSVVISAALLWWVRKQSGWRVPLSAGFIVGGAIGNAIDRVVHGAVADFLNMSCCGFYNPFSFNVADIAIFAGAIGLILFTGGKEKPTSATKT